MVNLMYLVEDNQKNFNKDKSDLALCKKYAEMG